MKVLFGQLPDGRDVHLLTLRSDAGLEAEVLTYGGILRSLRLDVDGRCVPLVLGLQDLPAYLADRISLGALVGRFGGRIADGRYTHDGKTQQLDINDGENHLHGGKGGFGWSLWTVLEQDTDRVLLSLVSEDGDNGYPGRVEVFADLRVQGRTLHVNFSATSDADTPFNPTHHPYFNLSGDPSIPASEQWLRVAADRYLPVDVELLPLGEIATVQDTPFDFRQAVTPLRNIDPAHEQIVTAGGYDHCLVLAEGADRVAELYSPHSGVVMRIDSNAPAVIFFGGQIIEAHHPGLGHGLCLEPQGYPDAPNRVNFPDTFLRPGRRYERQIAYRFATVAPGSDWEQAIASLG